MGSFFADTLLKWYALNKRDLPWRHTQDPYKIWLSEIILQQTQIIQGLAYYNKFIKTYPTVKHLANAKEDDVLKLWQGLGYYSRARNLHGAAKHIVSVHNGKFPNSYADIIALKGVGNYTAAAIASFAYNLPHAVVDGNVYRLLSRVFGIKTDITSTKGKHQFQELANTLLDVKQPAIYNQAIMEFGSQQCKPVNPNCAECVLNEKCYAYAHHKVGMLPVKLKKTAIKNRYLNYFLIIDKKGAVITQQRIKKDIWQGLFELFLIETDKETDLKQLLKDKNLKAILSDSFHVEKGHKHFKHILSHQHLFTNFYIIKFNGVFPKKYSSTSIKKLSGLAWPRVIDKFLNSCILP